MQGQDGVSNHTSIVLLYNYNQQKIQLHVLMRGERRKEERSKQGQTNNKAKQHSTPKAVTFPKKNELHVQYMLMRDAERRKKEASKIK